MDFGDILDRWDRQTGRGGRNLSRKTSRPGKADPAGDTGAGNGQAAPGAPGGARPPESPGPRNSGAAARNARTGDDQADNGNAALIQWLSDHEIPDKDRTERPRRGFSGSGDRSLEAAERRRRLQAKKPDATVDLHGLTRDEAWGRLETFFEMARREDHEKVLIVHGKGNHSPGESVLKETVRTFVERCAWAGESGRAEKSDGGSGATWVILKRPLR